MHKLNIEKRTELTHTSEAVFNVNMECARCKNSIEHDHIMCDGCKNKYHYDCCGQRETAWRNKSKEVKANWRCPQVCKGSTNTPDKEIAAVNFDSHTLRQILEKLSKLDTVADDIKDVKESIGFMSDKYDELLSEVQDIKKINEENKRDITRLRNENEHLYHLIKIANESVIELEQKLRSNQIEVHGIAYNEKENIKEIITTLARELRIPINQNDIVTVTRMIPNKKNTAAGHTGQKKPPPILVRFRDDTYTSAWLEKRKTGLNSSNIVGGSSLEQIYINENLCPRLKEIFWNARVQGKKLNYKFIWMKGGMIFMKRDEGSKPVRIKSVDDIPAVTLKEASPRDH